MTVTGSKITERVFCVPECLLGASACRGTCGTFPAARAHPRVSRFPRVSRTCVHACVRMDVRAWRACVQRACAVYLSVRRCVSGRACVFVPTLALARACDWGEAEIGARAHVCLCLPAAINVSVERCAAWRVVWPALWLAAWRACVCLCVCVSVRLCVCVSVSV